MVPVNSPGQIVDPASNGEMYSSLPAVAVVIAVHKPESGLFTQQLESIFAQRGVSVHIFAVLDGIETSIDLELDSILSDTRITVLRHHQTQGIRRAFLSGLQLALVCQDSQECYFSYADQDDVWYPDKLIKSLERLRQSGQGLIHCDARVTDLSGRELSHSLHEFEGRSNPSNLLEALLLNAVTGMTAVFCRKTARVAVSLMQITTSDLLHDHVTAVAAASVGKIIWLNEVLVDYTQHSRNALGAKPLQKRKRITRALTPSACRKYRVTSVRIYAARRELAVALYHMGLLPSDLQELFVVRPKTGSFAILWSGTKTLVKMLKAGQGRRALLLLRIIDVAIQKQTRDEFPPERQL